MMHLVGDDLPDEVANSEPVTDGVGTVVRRAASGPLVLEKCDGVDTRVVCVTGRHVLVEEVGIRFKSI